MICLECVVSKFVISLFYVALKDADITGAYRKQFDICPANPFLSPSQFPPFPSRLRSIPLPSPSFFLLLPRPLFPLRSRPVKYSDWIWVSAVSSPSGV